MSGSFMVDSDGTKLALRVVEDRPQAYPALKVAALKTSCPKPSLQQDPRSLFKTSPFPISTLHETAKSTI